MDALKALKKALKNKMTDEFEEGSVIRWKSADRYVYVVVKASGKWWITGVANYYGNRVFTFAQLIEILSLSEVSDVTVATAWTEIS